MFLCVRFQLRIVQISDWTRGKLLLMIFTGINVIFIFNYLNKLLMQGNITEVKSLRPHFMKEKIIERFV